MENCVKALASTGLYEGAMPIWQFDPALTEYDSQETLFNEPWHAFAASLSLWSDENLAASSAKEEHRRFIFPGFLPTAVRSLDMVRETGLKKGFFSSLPLLGGHIILYSLYAAIDEALQSPAQDFRVLRLYEASLGVTVRMRVSPAQNQIILDALTFSDTIRLQHEAVMAESFFEFVHTLCQLSCVDPEDTGAHFQEKLKSVGVQFRGKPIDKAMAFSILAVLTFARSQKPREAVRFVERISSTVL